MRREERRGGGGERKAGRRGVFIIMSIDISDTIISRTFHLNFEDRKWAREAFKSPNKEGKQVSYMVVCVTVWGPTSSPLHFIHPCLSVYPLLAQPEVFVSVK